MRGVINNLKEQMQAKQILVMERRETLQYHEGMVTTVITQISALQREIEELEKAIGKLKNG